MDRISRRSTLTALLALVGAADTTQIDYGGGSVTVSFRGADFDLPGAALVEWVRTAARAVTSYYGRYPISRAAIRIVGVPGRGGVLSGRSFGRDGAQCRMTVGQQVTRQQLDRDWTMTHEMVHFAFPSVEDRHHWIEEGSATYVEPIARAQVGNLSPREAWRDMVRDMPQGLPKPGDRGLDLTHTWASTYWGGALFCLVADVRIRERTGNAKGLQDALRAINRAGGTIDVEWPLEKAFGTGDKATGTTVLTDLYAEMREKPAPLDLPALWNRLGIDSDGKTIAFTNGAPLAAVREAILPVDTKPRAAETAAPLP